MGILKPLADETAEPEYRGWPSHMARSIAGAGPEALFEKSKDFAKLKAVQLRAGETINDRRHRTNALLPPSFRA